jgi:hypothetical protein
MFKNLSEDKFIDQILTLFEKRALKNNLKERLFE